MGVEGTGGEKEAQKDREKKENYDKYVMLVISFDP